jgi:hypothetical protein
MQVTYLPAAANHIQLVLVSSIRLSSSTRLCQLFQIMSAPPDCVSFTRLCQLRQIVSPDCVSIRNELLHAEWISTLIIHRQRSFEG